MSEMDVHGGGRRQENRRRRELHHVGSSRRSSSSQRSSQGSGRSSDQAGVRRGEVRRAERVHAAAKALGKVNAHKPGMVPGAEVKRCVDQARIAFLYPVVYVEGVKYGCNGPPFEGIHSTLFLRHGQCHRVAFHSWSSALLLSSRLSFFVAAVVETTCIRHGAILERI